MEPAGSGKADEQWYWITPLLLDIEDDRLATIRWWKRDSLAHTWAGAEASVEDDHWAEHVNEARESLDNVYEKKEKLGPMPHRSGRHPRVNRHCRTRQLHISSPRQNMWRSSGRRISGCRETQLRRAGRNFLSYFNHAEAPGTSSFTEREAEPYWLRVLEYLHAGCIQATLDEYSHVLRDSLGLTSEPSGKSAPLIADAVSDAITLRTAALRIDGITAPSYARRIAVAREAMRIRFAMHVTVTNRTKTTH